MLQMERDPIPISSMQTLQFVGWMIEPLVATSKGINDADLALNESKCKNPK